MIPLLLTQNVSEGFYVYLCSSWALKIDQMDRDATHYIPLRCNVYFPRSLEDE